MLGIVTALPMERAWLGVIDERQGPVVEVSGAGSRRAREAAQRLLERGVTALASWGVAAGLRREVGAGTVVLPRRVIASDEEGYDVDAGWHRGLLDRLEDRVEVSTGALVRSPHLLETAAAKVELGRRSGALAADMESATVGAVAATGGVPFLAVRVVLDGATSPLPRSVALALDSAGRVRPGGLWPSVLAHPEEWGMLLDLARSWRAARRAMLEVWRVAKPDLALSERSRAATGHAGSASL